MSALARNWATKHQDITGNTGKADTDRDVKEGWQPDNVLQGTKQALIYDYEAALSLGGSLTVS